MNNIARCLLLKITEEYILKFFIISHYKITFSEFVDDSVDHYWWWFQYAQWILYYIRNWYNHCIIIILELKKEEFEVNEGQEASVHSSTKFNKKLVVTGNKQQK